MQRATLFSFAACLIGAASPVWYGDWLGVAWTTLEAPAVIWMIGLGGWAIVPFLGLAITAWGLRRDRRASWTLTVASALAAALGLWGFRLGAEDPKGINLAIAAIAVPFGQFIIWGIGHGFAHARADREQRFPCP